MSQGRDLIKELDADPVWQHDCKRCKHVATVVVYPWPRSRGVRTVDLYACPDRVSPRDGEIVARFGDAPGAISAAPIDDAAALSETSSLVGRCYDWATVYAASRMVAALMS